MREIKRWGWAASLAVVTALGLAGCGGGSDGNQNNRATYTSLVTFGDSLSDVGTYKVGGVAVLGGGRYTINSAIDKNWTELLAAQLNLAAPCAAQTGLDGDPLYGFSVPIENHAECLNYAQGGSRVTNPVGPGNKNLAPDPSAVLGQLTVPVSTQIASHLAKVGGQFSGRELVTIMAGGNDVFMNLAMVGNGFIQPPTAVQNMGVAGVELATYIKTQILGKGATRVVALNIPDIKNTPFGLSSSDSQKEFIDLLVTTFNTQLAENLRGTPGVVLVDAYAGSRDEVTRPRLYGLSNVTSTACNLTQPSPNALGSSLVCNNNNVNPGDVSTYLFADSVHPTPYGYKLMSQLVIKELVLAGWL